MGLPSGHTLIRQLSFDSIDEQLPKPRPKTRRLIHEHFFRVVTGFLILSLSLNLTWGVKYLKGQSVTNTGSQSSFAGLLKNTHRPWSNTSIYHTGNTTVDDAAWDVLKNENRLGLVAISDDYAHSHGLLLAQRWPWDLSKGIYAINGFHLVHCVTILRHSIHSTRKGIQILGMADHIDHCLDLLRDDAMCNADDRLLYTGRVHRQLDSRFPFPGIGQQRKCRDWEELKGWAIQNSACYYMSPDLDQRLPTSERYKHCPDGRVQWPT